MTSKKLLKEQLSVMTPDQFAFWIKGFFDSNPNYPEINILDFIKQALKYVDVFINIEWKF